MELFLEDVSGLMKRGGTFDPQEADWFIYWNCSLI